MPCTRSIEAKVSREPIGPSFYGLNKEAEPLILTNVDIIAGIEECQCSVVARQRSSIAPIAPSNRAFLKRSGIPTALRCSLRWRGLMTKSAFATSRVPCRSNSRRSRTISAFFATPAWLRPSGAGRGCAIAWQTTPPNALTPHFAPFFRRNFLHEDALEPRNARPRKQRRVLFNIVQRAAGPAVTGLRSRPGR